jgi:ATP-dependent Lon protease
MPTDRLIAMATLDCKLDHWTDKQPPIASEICIGKIVSHAEVEDQRHNILLLGAKRARIRREMDTDHAFRIAEVEVLEDFYTPDAIDNRPQLRRRLLDAFAKVIPSSATTHESLSEILSGSMGLGPITDIIAYILPLATEDKLRLLSVNDVYTRTERLIDLILKSPSLDANKPPDSKVTHPFPPRFSNN